MKAPGLFLKPISSTQTPANTASARPASCANKSNWSPPAWAPPSPTLTIYLSPCIPLPSPFSWISASRKTESRRHAAAESTDSVPSVAFNTSVVPSIPVYLSPSLPISRSPTSRPTSRPADLPLPVSLFPASPPLTDFSAPDRVCRPRAAQAYHRHHARKSCGNPYPRAPRKYPLRPG